MKRTAQPYDFIDTLGEVYETLLESTQKKTHQIGAAVHLIINAILNNKLPDNKTAKLEGPKNHDLVKTTPYNFIDVLGEIYEALLETTLQKAHRVGSAIHQLINAIFGEPDNQSAQPKQKQKHALAMAPRYRDRTDMK